MKDFLVSPNSALYLTPEGTVDAVRHVNDSHLPHTIKSIILENSMVIGGLDTPCDTTRIIPAISQHLPGPISQIGYVYRAPGFDRDEQYKHYPELERESQNITHDAFEPGFYGFMHHPNNSFTVVFYIRQEVIQSLGRRTKIDPDNAALRAVFSHYRKVTHLLQQTGRPDPEMLAMVGILPGVAIKREKQLPGYKDLVEMQRQKNRNSGRFIFAAVQRMLERQGLNEEHLVILGSGGTLGSAVAEQFPRAALIDLHNQGTINDGGLAQKIVIDCTTGGSMGQYIEQLSPHIRWIWINEAYPTPSAFVVERANCLGIETYHIPGVAGETIPRFPSGYAFTPPCCMGLIEQSADTVRVGLWDGRQMINEF